MYAQADRLEYVRMLLEAGSEVNHRDAANHNSMLNLLVKLKRLGDKVVYKTSLSVCVRICVCLLTYLRNHAAELHHFFSAR